MAEAQDDYQHIAAKASEAAAELLDEHFKDAYPGDEGDIGPITEGVIWALLSFMVDSGSDEAECRAAITAFLDGHLPQLLFGAGHGPLPRSGRA